MRVIGGELRGRPMVAPEGRNTRPTTDRVRESLFSMICARLGTELNDLSVLDAFAGSGALGIEALSRGASRATFVERDRSAADALASNIASLGLSDRAQMVRGDVSALAKRGVLRGPFSLILLDAPYTLDPAVVACLLADLRDHGALASGALVTWEHALETSIDWPHGFTLLTGKRYGSTVIDIAVHEEGEPQR